MRVGSAIAESERNLKRERVKTLEWRTAKVTPMPRAALAQESLVEQLTNRYYPDAIRGRAAFMLAWKRCLERGHVLMLSTLRVNDVNLLHLPAECFVEYQLRAQESVPGRFVATAAYGDGGPWYIPVKEEYKNGGYELTSTLCDSGIDDLVSEAIQQLLK